MGDNKSNIVKRKIIRSSRLIKNSPVACSTPQQQQKTSARLAKRDDENNCRVSSFRLFADEPQSRFDNDESGYLADVSAQLVGDGFNKASEFSGKPQLHQKQPAENDKTVAVVTTEEMDKISLTSKSSSLDTNLTEDHFSYPELGQVALETVQDFEEAIARCKEMIVADLDSHKRETYVKKLVDLRLKLQNLKDEESGDGGGGEVKKVLSHHLRKVSNRTMKHYCDCCSTLIWGILQVRYKCMQCGFNCHQRCLESIRRVCVALTARQLAKLQLRICPETGLASQQYCCAECKNSIVINGEGNDEARMCDYTGLYYCSNCHWNDLHPTPARILHNWDHTPRKVCRQSYQLLMRINRRPILNIQEVNPMLFNFVEELSLVQKWREDILRMKPYLTTCSLAVQLKLLRKLGKRQHFVDNADMYTMEDLNDVHTGALVTELRKVYDEYTHHIRTVCSVCQAKGFVCEVCKSGGTLFPFDPMISSCPKCHAVFHGDCFSCIDTLCPRCKRLNNRRNVLLQSDHDDDDDNGEEIRRGDDTEDGFAVQERFFVRKAATPRRTTQRLARRVPPAAVETKKPPQTPRTFVDPTVLPSLCDFVACPSSPSPEKKKAPAGRGNPKIEAAACNPFLEDDGVVGATADVILAEKDRLNPFLNSDDAIPCDVSKNPFENDVSRNPFGEEEDDDVVYDDAKNPFV